MTTARTDWIDVAKGLGIILVVIGHAQSPLTDFIFAFHMPLFFVISGYLMNSDKWVGQRKSFAIHRFQRLIYPYLIACAFFYLFWFFVGRHLGEAGVGEYTSPWKPLLGILYGNGHDDWLIFNTPLWFLPCLFLAECTFMNLSVTVGPNTKKLVIGVCALALAGYGISKFVFLPWSLDVALVAQPFMLLGNSIRKSKAVDRLHGLWTMGLAGACALTLFAALSIDGMIDMNSRVYQNLILFYAGGAAGSWLVFTLASLITKPKAIRDGLRVCGRETLPIFTFHMLAFMGLSALVVCVFHAPLQPFLEGFWPLYALLGVALPLGVSRLFAHFKALKARS